MRAWDRGSHVRARAQLVQVKGGSRVCVLGPEVRRELRDLGKDIQDEGLVRSLSKGREQAALLLHSAVHVVVWKT